MNLLLAQRSQLSASKSKWAWVCRFRCLIVASAVVGAAIQDSVYLVLLALFMLLLSVAAFALRESAIGHDLQANALRSELLLEDSLGHPGDPGDRVQLATGLRGDASPPDTQRATYFASAHPLGAKRLAENVAESAFFTAYQSSRMVILYFVCYAGGALVAVVAFIVTIQFAPPQTTVTLSRATATLLAFLVAGDWASLVVGYHRQQSSCDAIFRRGLVLSGESSLETEQLLVDAMSLANKYTATLGHVPPFPDWLWARCEDKINRAWQDCCASGPHAKRMREP